MKKKNYIATYHGSTQPGWLGDTETIEIQATDLAKAKPKATKAFRGAWRDGSALINLSLEDNDSCLADAAAHQSGKTWRWETR